MSGHLGNTLSVGHMGDIAEACTTTEVADWVIALDLAPETHLLYQRMCRIAKDADRAGVRLTLTREQADQLSKGDGAAALRELLEVGAITKVSSYQGGKVRYEIQIFPPETRRFMGPFRQANGLPVVSYE